MRPSKHQTCTTPFSIGLYSSWGSGKTSVAKILRGLVIQDKPRALGFVYLDVWKYSSDPLKRWILFETERQLEDQEILRQSTFEGRGLQSHLEFEEKWEEKGPLQVSLATINFLGKVLAFSAVFSVPTYLAPLGSQLLRWLLSLSGLVSTVSAVGLLLQFTVKKILEAFEGVVFTRTTRHVASKPAFSAEKFGAIFHDITQRAKEKLSGGKVVFVFDNLDRCSEEVAVEVIAVLKTYLDEPGCVYVIPCDQEALVKHISRTHAGLPDAPTDAAKYANEFLNKFFQMTLRLPAPEDIEIDEYIDQQLGAAGMTDLSPEAKDVLSLGYRGETLRQVKRVPYRKVLRLRQRCKFAPLFSISCRMLPPQVFSFQAFALLPGGGRGSYKNGHNEYRQGGPTVLLVSTQTKQYPTGEL